MSNNNPPAVVVPPPVHNNSNNNKFYVTKVSSNDVLLGRGTGPNAHAGNCIFRQEVERNQDVYFSTTTDHTRKAQIVQEIITKVHLRGGRFLKMVNSSSTRGSAGAAGRRTFEVIIDRKHLAYKVKQTFRYLNEKKESSSTKILSHQRDCKNPPLEESSSSSSSEGPIHRGEESAIMRMPSSRQEQLALLLAATSNNRLQQGTVLERTNPNLCSNQGNSSTTSILPDELHRRLVDVLAQGIPSAIIPQAAALLHPSAQLPLPLGSVIGYYPHHGNNITGTSLASIQTSGLLRHPSSLLELRQLELAQQLLMASRGRTTDMGGGGGEPIAHQHQSLTSTSSPIIGESSITANSFAMALLMQQQQQQQQQQEQQQQQQENNANASQLGLLSSSDGALLLRHLLSPGSTSRPLSTDTHQLQTLQNLLQYHRG